MITDDKRVLTVIRRIVFKVSSNPAMTDDLMQEALVHLWKLEQSKPRQTTSWYLQSCRFHLLNHLSRGRCVDSVARNNRKLRVTETPPELEESDHSVVSQVSAQDLYQVFSKRLSELDREILYRFCQGCTPAEVASELNLAHQTVLKHRRKIAQLALKLGIKKFSF